MKQKTLKLELEHSKLFDYEKEGYNIFHPDSVADPTTTTTTTFPSMICPSRGCPTG